MTSQFKFPFDVYMVITVFSITIAFILKHIIFQIFIQLEWLFLLSLGLATLYFLILMFKQQYKKVTICTDKIEIKPLFSFRSQKIYFKDLEGFELFEAFFIRGFDSNIRIITKTGERIVLHKDNYDNYNKIIEGFKQSELQFLGLSEVNEKSKKKYGKLLKLSAITYPLIFILFLLTKTLINK